MLNKTEISTFNASRSELEDTLLPIADANNADGINAIDGYIEPFLKRGKLLTYAAGADYLIPSLSPVCELPSRITTRLDFLRCTAAKANSRHLQGTTSTSGNLSVILKTLPTPSASSLVSR